MVAMQVPTHLNCRNRILAYLKTPRRSLQIPCKEFGFHRNFERALDLWIWDFKLYMYICLSIYLYLYLYLYIYIYKFELFAWAGMVVSPSNCWLPVSVSVCLCVCLPLCLSVSVCPYVCVLSVVSLSLPYRQTLPDQVSVGHSPMHTHTRAASIQARQSQTCTCCHF